MFSIRNNVKKTLTDGRVNLTDFFCIWNIQNFLISQSNYRKSVKLPSPGWSAQMKNFWIGLNLESWRRSALPTR